MRSGPARTRSRSPRGRAPPRTTRRRSCGDRSPRRRLSPGPVGAASPEQSIRRVERRGPAVASARRGTDLRRRAALLSLDRLAGARASSGRRLAQARRAPARCTLRSRGAPVAGAAPVAQPAGVGQPAHGALARRQPLGATALAASSVVLHGRGRAASTPPTGRVHRLRRPPAEESATRPMFRASWSASLTADPRRAPRLGAASTVAYDTLDITRLGS
jgi:hypothetical protein